MKTFLRHRTLGKNDSLSGCQEKGGQLEVCKQVGGGLRKKTLGQTYLRPGVPSMDQTLTPEHQASTFLPTSSYLINLMRLYGMIYH